MAPYLGESTSGKGNPYRVWLYAAGVVILAAVAFTAVVVSRGRAPAGPPGPGSGLPAPTTASVDPKPTATAPVPRPTPPAARPVLTEPGDASVDAAIAEALATLNTDPSRLISVRDKLNSVLIGPANPQQRQVVKAKLAELADQWLFSPSVHPGDSLCQTYVVKPGDQLRIIGERHSVPYEVLMTINGITRPETLQAGQTLKVVTGPFHAKVSLSAFTLEVYLQNTFVKTYPVGLGKPGFETPTGEWRVRPGDKHIKPPWTDPDTGRVYRGDDPDYPLGSRWIGLEGLSGNALGRTGFALHGTNDPNQIGRPGSRGCIRLHNGDAVAVYNMLIPGLSRVRIED